MGIRFTVNGIEHMIYSSEEFRVGNVYYMVTYTDADRTLPIVRCLVFLGKDIEKCDEKNLWYFQDSESFAAVGPYPTNAVEPDIEIEVHRIIETCINA